MRIGTCCQSAVLSRQPNLSHPLPLPTQRLLAFVVTAGPGDWRLAAEPSRASGRFSPPAATGCQPNCHHREGPAQRQTSARPHVCYNHRLFNNIEELLYRSLEHRLATAVRDYLKRVYSLDLTKIVIEQPPKVELGEYAMPLAFELAKKLRKAPRKIAEEMVAGIGPIEGFEKLEVAGAGYINARVKRAAMAASLLADEKLLADVPPGKILVEHSSINPNKAAHIGHLRNAILGDTFVRLLRYAGREVDVQNYIDNTGVQVADVVVGFLYLEKQSRVEIEQLAAQPRFDYYCWDLYARVSQWYANDKQNLQARVKTLHEIEAGGNETAAIADLISVAVLRCHLETMDRLDIEYDFLPRESEILHLHFWDAAFTKLKETGVLFYETEGKNKGCWVMQRVGRTLLSAKESGEAPASSVSQTDAERVSQNEDNQKVIVRSNGTVGYVGKDIAYHMWKFGLLGKDFGYRKFYRYPNQHECWISAEHGEADHPHFGGVAEIYNVIDARQSEAQNTVIEALRALGHNDAADHYTHFSYEMVALTPRCAAELGYMLSDEDKTRAYIEVSGRKGFGVKADDLIDRLIASAKTEVDARHPEISDSQRVTISTQIAVGAYVISCCASQKTPSSPSTSRKPFLLKEKQGLTRSTQPSGRPIFSENRVKICRISQKCTAQRIFRATSMPINPMTAMRYGTYG